MNPLPLHCIRKDIQTNFSNVRSDASEPCEVSCLHIYEAGYRADTKSTNIHIKWGSVVFCEPKSATYMCPFQRFPHFRRNITHDILRFHSGLITKVRSTCKFTVFLRSVMKQSFHVTFRTTRKCTEPDHNPHNNAPRLMCDWYRVGHFSRVIHNTTSTGY